MREQTPVVLRQMTALAAFMYDPDGGAYDALSEPCRAELRQAFERLSAESQQMAVVGVNHG